MSARLDIGEVESLHEKISASLVRTPVLRCAALEDELGDDTTVFAKLEFLQRTGTFKARGALSVVSRLTAAQRRSGVTAVSAGNHAIAVAYAAKAAGISAKVVMLETASPVRREQCRRYGADIVLAADVHSAFSEAERISRDEGRYLMHPFEGEAVAMGTATLGAELCGQLREFDVLLIPVGGGGLAAGVASAVRQRVPGCDIIGVEPEGADTMFRSLAAGEPRAIENVDTIADSLGAPYALPYSFALCRANLSEVVRVSDAELKSAMRFLFRRMKIAVEPACAASTAALLGPLAGRVAGRRVVLVMCGSNIDWARFAAQAELA